MHGRKERRKCSFFTSEQLHQNITFLSFPPLNSFFPSFLPWLYSSLSSQSVSSCHPSGFLFLLSSSFFPFLSSCPKIFLTPLSFHVLLLSSFPFLFSFSILLSSFPPSFPLFFSSSRLPLSSPYSLIFSHLVSSFLPLVPDLNSFSLFSSYYYTLSFSVFLLSSIFLRLPFLSSHPLLALPFHSSSVSGLFSISSSHPLLLFLLLLFYCLISSFSPSLPFLALPFLSSCHFPSLIHLPFFSSFLYSLSFPSSFIYPIFLSPLVFLHLLL